MAEGCCGGCAKMMLIIFNYIFWMSGLAIIGVGIWFLVDPAFDHYFDIQETTIDDRPLLKYAAYILIGVGILVFFVGFIGCCGAIKENRCLLGVYILFMFLVMAGELAAGIYVLINRNKVKTDLLDSWQVAIRDDYTTNDDGSDIAKAFTKAQNILQVKMKCCGVKEGPEDYKNSTWLKATKTANPNMKVPYSCCLLKEGSKNKDPITEDDVEDNTKCQNLLSEAGKAYVHQGNCYNAVVEWLEDHATILIGIAIGIAGLELFGFIFAILLCRRAKD